MSIDLGPDVERIVMTHLREHDDVAAIVGRRVVVQTPSSTDTPWIRVEQLDAPSDARSPVDHLVGYLLQFDCYAGGDGGRPEATLLGRTVRAVLSAMPQAEHEGAVITSAKIAGHSRIPDAIDFEPARERVIITALIHARPA